MRLLFELSGEEVQLARLEVLASIEALGGAHEVEDEYGGLLVLRSEIEPTRIGKRIALCHFVDEVLGQGTIEELKSLVTRMPPLGGSFALRKRRIGRREGNAEEVASILGGKNRVDLDNPDFTIRLIISRKNYLCLQRYAVDRKGFEKRKVENRPFFYPISIHPKFARVLVNLSRVKEGDRLLDPFCGTGGILIEAGLVKARIIGNDVKKEMVRGCAENLNHYGLEGELLQCDVSEIENEIEEVDAIATDPPYGRSTTTLGEGIPSLYERTFSSLSRILKKGGYLSMILPSKELIMKRVSGLELKECYPSRIHRSLTRYFCTFRRS